MKEAEQNRTPISRVFLCLILVLSTIRGVAAPDKPNILLIYADDLGWKDVGYQGTDFYETPNIDQLATQGMVFTAGYAAAGNCTPSRACLLSGQYTPRHSVYAVGSTKRGPANLMRMKPTPNPQTPGDIMDSYLSGDCAPDARFNYRYRTTAQPQTGERKP